jgi:hypothetical protein
MQFSTRLSGATMDRRKFIKTTGVTAAGLSIAGCLGDESGEATDAEPDASGNNTGGGTGAAGDARSDFLELEGEITADSVGGLEVIERNLYATANGTGLTGAIENTGNQPYEFVEVNVTMYDDANEVLYEFVDEGEEAEIDGIFKPGERWNFNVRFQEVNNLSNIVRYTVQVNGDVANNTGGNASGEGNFLFDGNTVNIGSGGQVTDQNGQVLGNVSIMQNDQSQGQGFQNVRISPSGRVLNQSGQVVGTIQANSSGSGMNTTAGNNSTGSR